MSKIIIEGRVNSGQWASIARAYKEALGASIPSTTSGVLGFLVEDAFNSLLKTGKILEPVLDHEARGVLKSLGFTFRESIRRKRPAEIDFELPVKTVDPRIREAIELLTRGGEQRDEQGGEQEGEQEGE